MRQERKARALPWTRKGGVAPYDPMKADRQEGATVPLQPAVLPPPVYPPLSGSKACPLRRRGGRPGVFTCGCSPPLFFRHFRGPRGAPRGGGGAAGPWGGGGGGPLAFFSPPQAPRAVGGLSFPPAFLGVIQVLWELFPQLR